MTERLVPDEKYELPCCSRDGDTLSVTLCARLGSVRFACDEPEYDQMAAVYLRKKDVLTLIEILTGALEHLT